MLQLEYINSRIDTLYLGAHDVQDEIAQCSFSPAAFNSLKELACAPHLRFLACEILSWRAGPNTWDSGWDSDNEEDQAREWDLEFFSIFPALDTFIIADYDHDWDGIRNVPRPVGEVELVEPTQFNPDNEDEIALDLWASLDNLRKENPTARIPPAVVKEVLRAGVLMRIDNA